MNADKDGTKTTQYLARRGKPKCVNHHDKCYLSGPCPYCEKKVVTVTRAL